MEQQAQQHYSALESLRGVAALLVAIVHAWWVNPIGELGLVQHAYIAVDFFFVLSGFVICHAYVHRIQNGTQFAQFVWRRLGRLYPLHLAMLLVWLGIETIRYFGASWTSGVNPPFSINSGSAFLAQLFLVQAFTELSFNAPSWSISAELIVYLVFAVVVLATKRYRLTSFLSISGLALAFLLYSEPDLHRGQAGIYRAAFGFFLGAAAYTLGLKVRGAGFLGIVTVGLVWLFPYSPVDFLMPFVFCALILAMAHRPVGVLNSRPLRWLGEVSYSIYMVHYAVAWFFRQALKFGFGFDLAAPLDKVNTDGVTGSLALVAYITVVLLLSHFTFRWIEHPFRERAKIFTGSMGRGYAAKALPH